MSVHPSQQMLKRGGRKRLCSVTTQVQFADFSHPNWFLVVHQKQTPAKYLQINPVWHFSINSSHFLWAVLPKKSSKNATHTPRFCLSQFFQGHLHRYPLCSRIQTVNFLAYQQFWKNIFELLTLAHPIQAKVEWDGMGGSTEVTSWQFPGARPGLQLAETLICTCTCKTCRL